MSENSPGKMSANSNSSDNNDNFNLQQYSQQKAALLLPPNELLRLTPGIHYASQ